MEKTVLRNTLSIDINQAINHFLFHCEAKNLNKSTINFYKDKLQLFRNFISTLFELKDINSINVPIIKHFINWSKTQNKSNLATSTLRGNIVTLKIFFKFLYEEGYIKINPTEGIKLPKLQQKVIRILSEEQIKALLTIPDKNTFIGYRNYCILLTFLDTGIRLSELINLKINDIDWLTNTFFIVGKGNKERQVPFSLILKKVLEKYIRLRGDIEGQNLLFVNQFGERLKPRRVQEFIKNYGRKAGITNVRVSPHTFRHTFATYWIKNGGDIFTLQRILGHTTLDMVRQYVYLGNKDIQTQHYKYSLLYNLEIKDLTKRRKLFK